MKKSPKPEPDDKEQSERFIETAKELEADKNADEFDRAMTVIIPSKPAEGRPRPSPKQSSQ